MGKLVAVLGLGGLLIGSGALFMYYNDSYALTLPAREGWLHAPRQFYAERAKRSPGVFRDHLQFIPVPVADISALSETIHPWSGTSADVGAEDVREVFQKMIPVPSFSRCRGVTAEPVEWVCREWTSRVKNVTMRQRAYFTRRGRTILAVVFTAPDGHFGYFGEFEWWIRNVEWRGPSIAYAF